MTRQESTMTRMTAADLDRYMTEHPGMRPAGPEPGTWLEPCSWCDEPAVCDDDAPDTGRLFCSETCAADSRAYRVRMGYAN